MHILLVQNEIEHLQPERNRERVRELLRAAEVKPAALLVLPELFSTGALPEGFGAAEAAAVGKADRQFLADTARTAQAFVLGGTVDVEPGALCNLALLFDPGGAEIAAYRKVHPFSLGGEDRVFQPGNSLVTQSVEGFLLQPAICYDLRFPELFRAGHRRGVTLIALPANWPESRQMHWEILLRARAIENQCYVVGVNCVGTQNGIRYAGGSMAVSPKGEVIAHLDAAAGVAAIAIDPRGVAAWRQAFPAGRDRKPDAFWS